MKKNTKGIQSLFTVDIPNLYGFKKINQHGSLHTFHINAEEREKYVYLSYDTNTNLLLIGVDRDIWKDRWIIVNGIKISTCNEFDWLMKNVCNSRKHISEFLQII